MTLPRCPPLPPARALAGVPAERFVFEGFLPNRSAQRRERIRALAPEPLAIVFLEAADATRRDPR